MDRHPRFVVDLTGDGRADIIGFGDAGVWTALGNGDGTFQAPKFVLANFGYAAGAWRVDRHPRLLADLTGNGHADIIGFGDAGVWTALGKGDGTFQDAKFVLANFGYEAGMWRVDRHPRFVMDLTGNGHADIVGFGDAGVWTALGNGDGTFQEGSFVLPSFGYGTTVLALTQVDRAAGSRGVWRSTDGGANWTQVYAFSADEVGGQLEWALGSDHLVYVAVGNGLLISKDAGISFRKVTPLGSGVAQQANHVAVWQNAPADPAPWMIYVLGQGSMAFSADGGATWFQDHGAVPPNIGGQLSITANGNAARVMVVSPRQPIEVYVTADGSNSPAIWRADYTPFVFGTPQATWEQIVLPELGGQDSGNVFLGATRKGGGDLLFYGSQRSRGYIGPLEPASASDWLALDANIHVDLHGVLLSPDFTAVMRNGAYQSVTGTIWLLTDGGISRSTDGGRTFHTTNNARTLSCVNVAGVANPGQGPAFSLNAGDNSGFYSMDGGQHWSYQQYGGGDNDCSFADPLRAHAMLIFTPRWGTDGQLADHTRDGQTVAVYQTDPGKLPDGRAGTQDRRVVTGPPLLPSDAPWHDLWNADSSYGSRGSRPIVRGLPGEPAPDQGDYVFILFFAGGMSQVVRTQNILDIASRDEWATTATGPGQGANVYLQGPALPYPNLGIVQASGGHAATVFYVGGGYGQKRFGLWTWTAGATSWQQLVPGGGAIDAVRFFVDPYRPRLIYILDDDHVKRSDDGGRTWQIDQNLETQLTWGGRIAISSDDVSSGIGDYFDLVLTDMQFDPGNPLVRFAVGEGGAFMTVDGVNWTCLLHAGALTGRPTNCYYDWISNPADPALYVSFAGRSLVKITQLPTSVIARREG